MKRQRIALIIALAIICALCTAFAFGCSQKTTYYTVTFMDGQTQVGEPVKVEKGKKIAEYPDAVREDDNYVFDAWFKDDKLTKVWNHDIERVTKDTTLYAGFLYVLATPSNVAMDDAAFSNTLTWLQRGINADTDISVEISGTEITSGSKNEFVFESYKGHTDIYTVKWTPAQKPLGGVYSVKITCGADSVTADNLMFKGAGTEANPYLLTSQTDLAAVNTNNIAAGNYYKVAQSFTARISANNVAGKTFDGVLNGNGKTITLEASDCGLFAALGENAEVVDVTVAGAIANVQTNCVGAIAYVNRGDISYCTVSASLDSAVGVVDTLTGDKDGIEGGIAGIAGINYGDIACCTYSGTVKANVGGAGIAVINNGTVSLCSFTGTIGAANSNETGNSTKAYSYIGGIVAINYDTVEKSSTDGSGKLLAQRGEEGTNNNVGGIVALNQTGATVSECWFDGIRVHGNRNVGGIAGSNSGTIIYCYAGGDYHTGSKSHSYVGGLSNVGGIVGLSNDGGTVTNCFVTSNVYAYSGSAYKVAQNAVNSIYLGGNLDNRSGVATVTATEDNGNISIELVGDYATSNYLLSLDDTQLALLNGEGSAFTDKTNVRLACESISTVIEHTITVTINGSVIGTFSSVTGDSVSLKQYTPTEVPDGSYFAGWAVTANGEAVIEDGATVTYNSLEKYGSEQLTLYPVFIDGEKPQSLVLNVAVYGKFIDGNIVESLLEAYKNSTYFDGFENAVYTVIDGTVGNNNTNFVAAVKKGNEYGAFNIVIGFGSTINLTNLDLGHSSETTVTILKLGSTTEKEERKVAFIGSDTIVQVFADFLKTDEAKKIMNPAYVSEAEADTIEITLINDETQYGAKLTVSNATDAAKVTLPTLTPEEGQTFLGWTVSETAVDGKYLTGDIGYDDVNDLSTDGTLTLYARFSEQPVAKPDLVIAYYTQSNYCSEEEAETIKAEFIDYLKTQKNDNKEYNIVLRAYNGNVATLVDSVISDGDVDIIIGGGNNINTTAGTNSGEKLTIIGDKLAMPHKSSRNTVQLTGSELAATFMEYVAWINEQA